MRSHYCIFLILLTANCFAQESDIPDYRKKWESFPKVQEKEIRRDLAAFTYGGIDESPGKLPLKSLDALGFDGKVMKFKGDNMEVLIEPGIFDPKKHKLQFYENTTLLRIDAKPYYGDYGKVPKTTIASVTAIIDKDTIRLPATAFFDIYNPDFVYKDAAGVERTHNNVFLSPDKRTIYIYLLNRKASDKYEVTWVIRDKKYLKRVVDYNLL